MKRQKLISRRIQEYQPVKIAKKNWYRDKTHETFKGWNTRKNATDADNEFARASEAYLKKHPFAFIVACQLDMGKKAWKAWRGPLLIANQIGKQNFNPTYMGKINIATLRNVLNQVHLGARILPSSRAAKNMKKLSILICNSYGGKTHNIWEKANSFEELKHRLFSLPGFGVKLVNMACKIFLELGMVPQLKKSSENMQTLNVAPDVHVKRVFFRSGLCNTMDTKDIMNAAQKYFPKMPMALDSAFFIGREYCFKTTPNCTECYLSKTTTGKRICLKRMSN